MAEQRKRMYFPPGYLPPGATGNFGMLEHPKDPKRKVLPVSEWPRFCAQPYKQSNNEYVGQDKQENQNSVPKRSSYDQGIFPRNKFSAEIRKDSNRRVLPVNEYPKFCAKSLPKGKPQRHCNEGIDNDEDEDGGKTEVTQKKYSYDVGSLSLRNQIGGQDAAARNKVREKLRLFQAVCRKLLQEKERESKKERIRVDWKAVNILKGKWKYSYASDKVIGAIPGVEIGDEFQYVAELNIIGLHQQSQGGIDFVKIGNENVATSIISSGGYEDDLDNSDVLTYMGQGGNVMQKKLEPEDQKLVRGNLALANSKAKKTPVRVISGVAKSPSDADARGRTYTYYGLYLVKDYWKEQGPHGKQVFQFKLERMQNQPEVPQKLVKSSRKSGIREGVCVKDISLGKELFPVSAINLIDNEKPPRFEYITRILYPAWWRAARTEGCNCTSACSSGNCACILKNGGEIPYNYDGALVRTKALVYECGPSCKCPPSCYNKVSQHGIKYQLEIFKTGSRGWGVRCLDSIPSGSFICEYVGELLTDEEAEKRSNDVYLFDIGSNYMDSNLLDGLSTLVPDNQSSSSAQDVQDTGFTLDAARYGNVGRFINHSCSPNLYAQNVFYDHLEMRVPHVMLFAAENIHPLQELTYHYHCQIDSVYDADGNIRKKPCYCGSSVCSGRIY